MDGWGWVGGGWGVRLQPMFFKTGIEENKHFASTKHKKKTTQWNYAEKIIKMSLHMCQNLVENHFSFIEGWHESQYRHARFPVSRDVYYLRIFYLGVPLFVGLNGRKNVTEEEGERNERKQTEKKSMRKKRQKKRKQKTKTKQNKRNKITLKSAGVLYFGWRTLFPEVGVLYFGGVY